jgi:hypothetical protein
MWVHRGAASRYTECRPSKAVPCRGSMDAAEATSRYTGRHLGVPAEVLVEVTHYAKYAAAAYGVELNPTRSAFCLP